MSAYADCEPAITDDRLAPIIEATRKRYFPWLEETEFATARVLNPEEVWEVHFLLVTPDPRPIQRRYGSPLADVARTLARDWDASEEERSRYVGKPDPAVQFFSALGLQHVRRVKSAHEQIIDADRQFLREVDALKNAPLVH